MQAARGASLSDDAQPRRNRSRLGLILGIAALGWMIDQGTKILAVHHLGEDPVDLVGSVLRLHLTRNPGAAFSTGTSFTAVISVFACVALGVVLVLARRVRTPLWGLAFGLLLAGILGNLTDRMLREPGPLRGHVIDFLELPNWPIFNVADICINVAAGLIVLQTFRGIPLAGRPPEADREPAEAPR